jgi:hypothetical protein
VAKASDTLVATASTPAGTNPTAATATLASSFADPMHWSGTGATDISWTQPADISAGSTSLVDFKVTSPVTYAFNGNFAATPSGCCSNQEAQASASLSVFSGQVDEDREEIFNNGFGFGTRRVVTIDSERRCRSPQRCCCSERESRGCSVSAGPKN